MANWKLAPRSSPTFSSTQPEKNREALTLEIRHEIDGIIHLLTELLVKNLDARAAVADLILTVKDSQADFSVDLKPLTDILRKFLAVFDDSGLKVYELAALLDDPVTNNYINKALAGKIRSYLSEQYTRPAQERHSDQGSGSFTERQNQVDKDPDAAPAEFSLLQLSAYAKKTFEFSDLPEFFYVIEKASAILYQQYKVWQSQDLAGKRSNIYGLLLKCGSYLLDIINNYRNVFLNCQQQCQADDRQAYHRVLNFATHTCLQLSAISKKNRIYFCKWNDEAKKYADEAYALSNEKSAHSLLLTVKNLVDIANNQHQPQEVTRWVDEYIDLCGEKKTLTYSRVLTNGIWAAQNLKDDKKVVYYGNLYRGSPGEHPSILGKIMLAEQRLAALNKGVDAQLEPTQDSLLINQGGNERRDTFSEPLPESFFRNATTLEGPEAFIVGTIDNHLTTFDSSAVGDKVEITTGEEAEPYDTSFQGFYPEGFKDLERVGNWPEVGHLGRLFELITVLEKMAYTARNSSDKKDQDSGEFFRQYNDSAIHFAKIYMTLFKDLKEPTPEDIISLRSVLTSACLGMWREVEEQQDKNPSLYQQIFDITRQNNEWRQKIQIKRNTDIQIQDKVQEQDMAMWALAILSGGALGQYGQAADNGHLYMDQYIKSEGRQKYFHKRVLEALQQAALNVDDQVLLSKLFKPKKAKSKK